MRCLATMPVKGSDWDTVAQRGARGKVVGGKHGDRCRTTLLEVSIKVCYTVCAGGLACARCRFRSAGRNLGWIP